MASTSPSTSTSSGGPTLPPNHHADHPGFAGVSGAFAALTFMIGRGRDADLAVELTGLAPADDVVDIGCGPGVAARRAARRASSVVGVDPAAVMLRVGRALTRAGRRDRGHRPAPVRFVEGAAEALPVPDGAASVVWSLATVHHWQDVDAGLAEVRRVLRPSGRFLVIERRVEPGASGLASHGWTAEQARVFADRCRAAGFTGVGVHLHGARRRRRLSVLARAV